MRRRRRGGGGRGGGGGGEEEEEEEEGGRRTNAPATNNNTQIVTVSTVTHLMGEDGAGSSHCDASEHEAEEGEACGVARAH